MEDAFVNLYMPDAGQLYGRMQKLGLNSAYFAENKMTLADDGDDKAWNILCQAECARVSE